MTTFAQLNLDAHINKALNACGYTTPTPIQAEAIPVVLAGGDLVACAQTGSGKTASFVLPALHRLSTQKGGHNPRVLILTPTRELASQITDAATKYGKFMRLNIISLVGGMPYRQQLRNLSRPVDIIVATPGRLLDHMGNRRLNLSEIEMLVLDEADRMLDMGFIDDVREIARAIPDSRQTLLFSATVDKRLSQVIRQILNNPTHIDLSTQDMMPTQIKQELYFADNPQHKSRLLAHFISEMQIFKAIIFSATKINADRLAHDLEDQGFSAAPLHGDLKQSVRNRTIEQLRRGKIQYLVATDVAARGIDINDITHVINYDLPKFSEDYVHRIGRTGRAGKDGIAISIALPSDARHVLRIERYTGQPLERKVIEGLEPTKREKSVGDFEKRSKGSSGKKRFGSRGGEGYKGKRDSAGFGDKKKRYSREERTPESTSRSRFAKDRDQQSPKDDNHFSGDKLKRFASKFAKEQSNDFAHKDKADGFKGKRSDRAGFGDQKKRSFKEEGRGRFSKDRDSQRSEGDKSFSFSKDKKSSHKFESREKRSGDFSHKDKPTRRFGSSEQRSDDSAGRRSRDFSHKERSSDFESRGARSRKPDFADKKSRDFSHGDKRPRKFDFADKRASDAAPGGKRARFGGERSKDSSFGDKRPRKFEATNERSAFGEKRPRKYEYSNDRSNDAGHGEKRPRKFDSSNERPAFGEKRPRKYEYSNDRSKDAGHGEKRPRKFDSSNERPAFGEKRPRKYEYSNDRSKDAGHGDKRPRKFDSSNERSAFGEKRPRKYEYSNDGSKGASSERKKLSRKFDGGKRSDDSAGKGARDFSAGGKRSKDKAAGVKPRPFGDTDFKPRRAKKSSNPAGSARQRD